MILKVTRKCTSTPKTPDTPKELPHTGTSEVVLAMVIVTAIGIGGAYYFASMKQLSKLEAAAKGKK